MLDITSLEPVVSMFNLSEDLFTAKMDADIEMVKRRTEEVGPAEDLNTTSPTETRLCRQNLCFAAAMVSCLLVMLFFINTSYQGEVDRPLDDLQLEPVDGGEISEGLDNSVVSAGVAQLKPHHHHHNRNKHPSNNTGPPGPQMAPSDDSKVQEWLDAKVTLEDGVKFEVAGQLHHDKKSFTEGLVYVDGKLYESVGMNGHSALLVLDPDTGDTLERYNMDSRYFAEGLTHVDGKLIQLTYKSNTGFIYDIKNLTEAPKTFVFHSTTNEGWGLTYDPVKHELIESDGSEFLHFWDPDTMQEKRKVAVMRMDGTQANNINELEYWRGRVIANLWYRDILLVIHPETGIVEKEYGA